MKTTIEKQPKSTISLKVVVPVTDVTKTYNKILDDVVKEATLPGFRKGMAPKDKVLEKANVSELYGDVVNELLQTFYPQALKEHHITPISNPKVEINHFDLEKDFEFTATIAIRPEVKIKDYEKALKKAQDNKEKEAAKQQKDSTEKPHVHLSVDEVLDTLLDISELEVADLLVEEEANRMLGRLVNQAQTVGLSLEDYLKAQNKSKDELTKEYQSVAERTLKAEFVLSQLVADRKIEVTDHEVDEAIKSSGQPTSNPMDKIYVKSILAKNNLIMELIDLASGHTHKHDHEEGDNHEHNH